MTDTPPSRDRPRQPGAPRSARPSGPIPPGQVPNAGRLREAALAHLARFAATEAGLVRVLDRRVQRWARRAQEAGEEPGSVAERAQAARQAVRQVSAELAGMGAVDDALFAEARVRSLARSGRSRRAALAHLAQKGVSAELAQAALPEDGEAELAAALALARKRRVGPFARDAGGDLADGGDGSEAAEAGWGAGPHARALAVLARAGFAREVAERALAMEPEEALARVMALRQG